MKLSTSLFSLAFLVYANATVAAKNEKLIQDLQNQSLESTLLSE